MPTKRKISCSIVVLAVLIFCYFVIYPIILGISPPDPYRIDGMQRSKLKRVLIALSMYVDDFDGLMPTPLEKMQAYFSSNSPINEFKLPSLSRFPAEGSVPALLVAYTSKPIPRAPSPSEYLFFFNLRNWPTESIEERRYMIFSNGEIKIVEEAVFKEYLDEQIKIIKKIEEKSGKTVHLNNILK
jgi:hypothetical protein